MERQLDIKTKREKTIGTEESSWKTRNRRRFNDNI